MSAAETDGQTDNETDGEVFGSASTLRDALIAEGQLTPEDAARIDDVMRTMGLGFGDAAIRLGLITIEQIEDTINAARKAPPKDADAMFESPPSGRPVKHGLPVRYVRTVKAGPSLMLAYVPESAYCEQIRTLRTELMLLNGASRTGVVIGILSPCSGEGRTQLCAELAIAFSQLGQRTLLVDGDLRRPRIHMLFPTDKVFGLGQALASGRDPELLNVELLPYLSVMIAGPNVPNPLELLTSGHFQRHMARLRSEYSLIIVDTPPVTEFSDGLAIASFAEQVVIVGRLGSTPHKNMKEMLRRMGSTQSKIVGAVINSF